MFNVGDTVLIIDKEDPEVWIFPMRREIGKIGTITQKVLVSDPGKDERYHYVVRDWYFNEEALVLVNDKIKKKDHKNFCNLVGI